MQCNFREKVRCDPLHIVAKLSRDAGISRCTGGCVMGNLNMRSRAHQKGLKLMARDKWQCHQQCRQLLQRLHAGTGPCIFLDEAKIDLMWNSTKDRIIERVAGEFTQDWMDLTMTVMCLLPVQVTGDAGINKRRPSGCLMERSGLIHRTTTYARGASTQAPSLLIQSSPLLRVLR